MERIASRIILMPVIAGVSYELIRYAGAHTDNPLVRIAIYAGTFCLQKLTTRQPDDSQIEVAIASTEKRLCRRKIWRRNRKLARKKN